MDFNTFSFDNWQLEEYDDCLKLNLHYSLQDSASRREDISFVERYSVPLLNPLRPSRRLYVDKAVELLHFIAGVSYYKTCVPKRIATSLALPSKATAEALRAMYLNGLGEFSYKNNLDLSDQLVFPVESSQNQSSLKITPQEVKIENRTALVPLGGGKDSIVTCELLKRHTDYKIFGFVLGNYAEINSVAEALEAPLLTAQRKLDPRLFELNSQGALNGHVPISFIYSLTAMITALANGIDTVVLSQERSASSANTTHCGRAINHQYSKSLEAEILLSELVRETVSPALRCFSLLRPFSEIHIAKLFSSYTQYHQVFTSCNRAFRLKAEDRQKWCLDCPKCRFVFLSLAPFLSCDYLVIIFGENLLDLEKHWEGYQELLGLKNFKPFECVGEVGECRAALASLTSMDDWKDSFIVKKFLEATSDQEHHSNLNSYLTPSSHHRIPAEFQELIDAS